MFHHAALLFRERALKVRKSPGPRSQIDSFASNEYLYLMSLLPVARLAGGLRIRKER